MSDVQSDKKGSGFVFIMKVSGINGDFDTIHDVGIFEMYSEERLKASVELAKKYGEDLIFDFEIVKLNKSCLNHAQNF